MRQFLKFIPLAGAALLAAPPPQAATSRAAPASGTNFKR